MMPIAKAFAAVLAVLLLIKLAAQLVDIALVPLAEVMGIVLLLIWLFDRNIRHR